MEDKKIHQLYKIPLSELKINKFYDVLGVEKPEKLIYVASGEGLSLEINKHSYVNLLTRIIKAGYAPNCPWLGNPKNNPIELAKVRGQGSLYDNIVRDAEIYISDQDMVLESDGVFAIMDGLEVDSGVCVETTIASENNIPVLMYRGDFRPGVCDWVKDDFTTGMNLMPLFNAIGTKTKKDIERIEFSNEPGDKLIKGPNGMIFYNLDKLEEKLKEVFD